MMTAQANIFLEECILIQCLRPNHKYFTIHLSSRAWTAHMPCNAPNSVPVFRP
ncbi:hypothetical protein HBI56_133220 [Parastagonospora nodorum]|uniref:Uncharacterized protein n=1 Tax=Phaeosphaeria nodorum (strain SN15 / ATCC MYA-4574 / FGSC 10173) TaxID=321614 RepID=A0A7U2F785_PHANO|nr:hypothetical protein HBH56_036330 [Parastagonospora nodorum]QRD00031.1 hypothetical protein JI435_414440 [Parastagonospora nodorum SN15]KAH3933557.1 hypothetical protein HBH54_063140 [Parastagonospora nodorum]KAH3952831.1 hypothetical protein HBH53_046970 [Parastagonospora nodorum]KAH3979702.1 hypothetical protein HBH51_057990 [Parastagonospora nodorum]